MEQKPEVDKLDPVKDKLWDTDKLPETPPESEKDEEENDNGLETTYDTLSFK